MTEANRIEAAAPGDMPGVAALLEGAGLPVPGGADRPVRFLVARGGDGLAGCIGWEDGGDAALLRSCAVAPERRGGGVGSRLVRGLAAHLAGGTSSLYLLTLDQAPFFARLGFAEVPRDDVPRGISDSHEFVLHHCDEAVAMRADLPLP